MSYINTATGVSIYINGVDRTEYLIQGSLSDDSVYSNSIITTTGQIILGGSTDVFDFNRTQYPIGSTIDLWCQLDNGEVAKHPKGRLYLINSNVNVEDRLLTLEVGCSLAFISSREEQYLPAVRSLFSSNLASLDRQSFQIDQYDLSTLSSLLESVGKVIYQDKYGYIQSINAFGSDGLGSTIASPKLTSFDKYTAISIQSISETAIEPDVDSIKVEASIDIPTIRKDGDGGIDDDEENPVDPTEPFNRPPPLTTSTTFRTAKAPGTTGNLVFGYGPDTLTSQSNPKTGTAEEPEEFSGTIGYNYQMTGEMSLTERLVKETAVSGRYVEYEGPGNQVSLEQSWEYTSAASWAKTAVTNSLNLIIPQVNQGVEEINGLLQKTNQFWDRRDTYDMTLDDGSSNPDWYLNHYKGSAFFNTAEGQYQGLAQFVNAANSIALKYDGVYNLSNFTETTYRYGNAGEVLQKIEKTYVHPASFTGAQSHIVTKSWVTTVGPGGEESPRFDLGYTVDWKSTGIVTGGGEPTGKVNISNYILTLSTQNTRTYSYSSGWTTEVEDYVDYQDSSNNYRRESSSSSTSSNASSPDRIIDSSTAEDSDYLDGSSVDAGINGAFLETSSDIRGGVDSSPTSYCDIETESKDINYTLYLSTSQNTLSAGWFGSPTQYQKVVSMPLSFTPIKPIYNSTTQTCTLGNVINTVSNYFAYVRNYAAILARKIKGDNKGFRVTEKMRAEVFAYYPFFPVGLSFSSANKGFYTRVAASNWVFDSQNAVCSFDCMVAAEKDVVIFPDPSTKVYYKKTEGNKIITTTDLKLQSTANEIKVTTVPTIGALSLSGNPVTAGQIISFSSIQANNLVFIPPTSDTTIASFDFEVLDSSGDTLDSVVEVYPPDTSTAITSGNYRADGGDFTNGTSNNGINCDGGDFTANTVTVGPEYMDAGNFDSGTTIVLPPPSLPSAASTSNGDTDPEADLGIEVKDADNTIIQVSTLPFDEGAVTAVFDINLTTEYVLDALALLEAEIVENLGWDYGYINVPLGTDIDFATIANPNTYSANFGSITLPIEPVLASYVS